MKIEYIHQLLKNMMLQDKIKKNIYDDKYKNDKHVKLLIMIII